MATAYVGKCTTPSCLSPQRLVQVEIDMHCWRPYADTLTKVMPVRSCRFIDATPAPERELLEFIEG